MAKPQIIDPKLRFTGPLQKRSRTDFIVLHHAAATRCTIEDVHRWHLARQWLGCGYNLFVAKDGQIFLGRPLDAIGAHCKDHNDHSIGVCAEGDYTKEQMPPEQERALAELVAWLLARYPGVTVKRHSDLNATACPGQFYPFDRIVAAAREPGTPILGPARATVEQAQAWARSRGATELFISLAPLYWEIAPQRGGVEPAGAYCQAAKETAFGRFGGVLDESFRNVCGMKTRQGGSNTDPNAHQRFASWEESVTAHCDHLALYAGAPGYPRADTPDPRHFPYLLGKARTYEELGGKWAPNPDYGRSIVRDYLQQLLATAEAAPESPPVGDAGSLDAYRRALADLEAAHEQLLAEHRRVAGELQAALDKLARIREIVA